MKSKIAGIVFIIGSLYYMIAEAISAFAFNDKNASTVGAPGGVNFKTRTVMIIAKIASKNVSNLFVFIIIPLYLLINKPH